MRSHARIAIIGAGIIGSAIAYILARRGADVLLLDEAPKPGSGVTGRAFGWINTINGTPGDAHYPLWLEAIAEYRRLKAALPEALSTARAGSLVWEATPQETERLVALHKRAGARVDLVMGKHLAEWEPALRRVPECAAFSPDDLALNPAQLAETLVATAIASGARAQFGAQVTAIETEKNRVTGIQVTGHVVRADIVILAAGTAIKRLSAQLGIDTGIATSPALLLRYACNVPFISHILCGPRLEIRQANDNMLFVAKSYGKDGAAPDPQDIGERNLAVMREELDLPPDVGLISAEVGHRPIFADGLPRLGFLPQIGGLYIAAGHPGVILAPLIGRLATEEILDERRSGLIPASH